MKSIITFFKKIRIPKSFARINLIQMLGLYRFKTNAIIVTSVVIFLVSNMVLSYVSLRLDLSKGKAYTLSNATKKMVKELKTSAEIKFYVSNNLPARLQPLKREVVDILREYERSSGNVILTIVEFNPDQDVTIAEEAQGLGITPVPIREQAQSEVSLTEIYFGLEISYNDKKSVLAQSLDVENFEYNVTSAIYQMTRETLPKVAVMGIPDSFNPQQDALGIFKQVTGRLFDVQIITTPQLFDQEELNTEEEPFTIDPDVDSLVVIDAPSTDFTKAELAEIEKYATKGNVIFMLNGITLEDTLTTGAGEAGLIDLVKKYGISVEPNLILSGRSEFVNLGGGGFSLLVPYPLWIWTSDFSSEESLFTGVGRVTFPWASTVTAKERNGYTPREIIYSGKESWEQTGTFILDPQKIEDPGQEELKVFPLAVESTKKDAGKIMVLGSARFILSNYLSRESHNLEFILNVLGDYASDGALSGISSRAVNLYPLPELPENVQEFYKYANIIVLPGIFALYGMWRLWKRNQSRG